MHARTLVAAALVSSIVLAGCVSPLDPAGTASSLLGPTAGVVHGADGLGPDGRAALGLAPAAGAAFSIGVNAFEPTLGVTPDGVLFMTGFASGGAAGGGGPTIMRSTDFGLTWVDKGPALPTGTRNPPTTNDPYVYVDPATGRVFDLDLHALLCSTLKFSDDHGETWTANPAGCGLPPGVHDHQTIAAGKPRTLPTVGYENVVYYCVNRVADSACASSLNGGLTFGPLVTAFPGFENGELCGGLHGHVETGPDGKVYLPKAQCGVPEVAVSEDDGISWTRHVIADVPAYDHEVSVAIDDDNGVHAFWLGEDGLPYLASSADGGASWTAPRMVAPPGVTATEFPAIAAGADGRIAFAYVGTTIDGGYAGKDTGVGGLGGDLLGEPEPAEWREATWNAYVGVMTNAFADAPTIVTATANDPADPIARGLCGRTRCGGMGDFIDVVVDADGRPWAAFVDVCTGKCVTSVDVPKDEPLGFVGTLRMGPALRGDAAALPDLADLQTAAATDDGHGH